MTVARISKVLKVDGDLVAYTTVPWPDSMHWGVAICRENEKGYRLVEDYGPYQTEERAQGIVDRLNSRLKLTKAEALMIVVSTLPGFKNRRKRRGNSK